MSSRRTNGCPKTERTIDMHPSIYLARDFADFANGIACSCVHVAHLDANNYGPRNARDLRRFHSSLRIGRDYAQLRASKTEQAQRLDHCCVHLLANDYCDRRCAKQTMLLKIPAKCAQEVVARGREGGDIGHLRTSHKRSARRCGKTE